MEVNWLEKVAAIAQQAGNEIMKVYHQTEIRVETKEDDSPLTLADRAAHELIVKELKNAWPDIPILSEEATDQPGRATFGAGRYWLVDPLDGTKEFIKKNDEFTVNIALIEDGQPVLGVVHAPALGSTYSATALLGAFKQATPDADWETIECATHEDNTPWRVVGSRSHAGDSLKALMNRLGPVELVPMGSSLKLCLVAEGKADLYPRLGPTSLWDTAAAQCVVESAGGRVITLTGAPLGYGNTSALLNPYFIAHGRSKTNWPDMFAKT